MNRKYIKIALITTAVVGLIAGTIYVVRRVVNKAKELSGNDGTDSTPAPDSLANGGPKSSSSITPNPFSNKSELNAFQNWVLKNKGAILGKAGADGVWGKYTASAWDKFGNEYRSSPNAPVLPKTTPPPGVSKEAKALQANAEYIISQWKGDKDQLRKRLEKASPSFVSSWKDTIMRYKASGYKQYTGFIYNGVVYDVVWGIKRTSKNPIGKNAIVKVASAAIYSSPTEQTYPINARSGTKLGLIDGYKYDSKSDKLFLKLKAPVSGRPYVAEKDVNY